VLLQRPSAGGPTIQFGVRIPLRDGVELSANLYLPPDPPPAPALVALTPYTAQALHNVAMHFAAAGYPFVAVDVRGRGSSGGEFEPMINEGADGHDVVEWAARQSFCNGKVGMWGGSYCGYVQWMTAAQRPPSLATIVPAAAPYAGVDVPFRKNIPKPYFMQWLMYVSGKAGHDQIFADQAYWRRRFREWSESGTAFLELDEFLGLPSPTFRRWMSEPCRNAFWDAYNPTPAQYARIDIPVLTITGMCDADQPGALMHYREHLAHASASAAPHALLMGPWDHPGTREPKPDFLGIRAGPASVLDLRQLHLEWYDWTLRDGPRPAFLADAVTYYVLGADEWRSTPSLAAASGPSRTLHLNSAQNPTGVASAGTLHPQSPEGRPADSYVYDPKDLRLASLEEGMDSESRADQRMVLAGEGRQLVYDSAPFERDTDVTGFFSLSAWISIDQPDTDFRAWIYELSADGSAILLSFDSLRARYRESAHEAKLVATDAPLRYDFDNFLFVSKRIAADSRLRLVIGPIHSIYAQRNHNSGKVVAEETFADARVVNVTLHHDAAHPSVLRVPFDHKDTANV